MPQGSSSSSGGGGGGGDGGAAAAPACAPMPRPAWNAPAAAPAAPAPAVASDRGVCTPLVGPVDCGFAVLTLEEFPELAMPRLNVRAVRNVPIDDEGITRVFATVDAVLARGAPLTILWDVRGCSIPSRKQIGVALDWIGANSHLLDAQLQGIAICLQNLIVRSIVNMVLGLTQPPQPHGVFADEPPAFAFARDACTEVKQWIGSKKKKALQKAAEQELKQQKQQQRQSLAEESEGGSPTSPTPSKGLLSPRLSGSFVRQGSRSRNHAATPAAA